ncbi:MAG: hypothetical protein MZW92_28370 [Comamonadaceae bacterium]|nr:hypothetical protein [Comamonadaceae bacterium]
MGYERGVNATTGTWQLIYRIAQRFTLRAQSGRGQLAGPAVGLAPGRRPAAGDAAAGGRHAPSSARPRRRWCRVPRASRPGAEPDAARADGRIAAAAPP